MSVVTPVYNGAAHLEQCIESVLAQTYSNWDYTIVNNCSTDETLSIAQRYAARDTRIRIHENTTFLPVIGNYNQAFRQASPQSEYCKVVAADDWLAPDCLDRMVRLGEEHPRVGIIGAYQLYGAKVMWQGLEYGRNAVPGAEVCRMALLGGPDVFGTATTVMFRTCLVRIRPEFYNPANVHADTEACFEFLDRHDFGFVHQVLTSGGVRADSLTSASDRLNTYLPHRVYLTARYGPKYLSPEELEARLDQLLREYYTFLGRAVFTNRDPEFWRYHSSRLTELGYPLSKVRLCAAAGVVAADLVLNPKSAVEKMLRVLRKRA